MQNNTNNNEKKVLKHFFIAIHHHLLELLSTIIYKHVKDICYSHICGLSLYISHSQNELHNMLVIFFKKYFKFTSFGTLEVIFDLDIH